MTEADNVNEEDDDLDGDGKAADRLIKHRFGLWCATFPGCGVFSVAVMVVSFLVIVMRSHTAGPSGP